MHTLIFEGIATSGKSTIIAGIEEILKDKRVKVDLEPETHIPIMEQTDEIHIEFFLNLITQSTQDNPEFLIFDRLYITQAFRAKRSLTEYKAVEDALVPYSPTTIFLKVDETKIAERVQKAVEHRDKSWGEYVNTKGETPDEIATYYITQQRNQLKLLEQSTLPYTVFDTTNHNYEVIISDILGIINV